MSGLGRKTFAPGEVLRSADVNGYLMDQTVMSFAGTAARGSAIGTAVSEGMVSYLDDSNSLEVYKTTGTAVAGWEPVNLAQSPNYIINGAFDINQRNFTSNTSSGLYGFDRWITSFNTGTVTTTPQTFSPGELSVASVEPRNYTRIVVSGQSGTAASVTFTQRVEDVRTLAGRTATISFWAKASSSALSVAPEARQTFGSGGSTAVNTLFGKILLSTSWARYSATVTIPSIAGKTVGSDSFVQIQTWLSAGSDFNDRTNSLGIQSGTFEFWGVQLEEGQTATPFRRNGNSFQGELAACQRYYFRIAQNTGRYAVGYAKTTTTADITVPFPTTMRIAPTALEQSGTAGDYLLAYQNTAQACSAAPTFQNATTQSSTINFTVASGLTAGNGLNAGPNGANSFLGWSAEL